MSLQSLLRRSYAGIISFFLILMFLGNSAGSVSKEEIKADLSIRALKIRKIGETSSGDHRVRITVTVMNTCSVVKCVGPFSVKVEKSPDKSGRYETLGESTVPELCSSPRPTIQRYFDDIVSINTSRFYKATVDARNQVNEENESNNEKIIEYSASPEKIPF